jgi:methylase of polypeptide subunit release factors
VVEADLFDPGQADLIVCNPPWVPAEARIPSDYAVYDPDSRMLRGFLGGLRAQLNPGGEGWLIISDLAERLGLRSRGELLDLIEDSGLRVIERHDTRPTHARSADASDPLHAARAREITSLWRLGASA